MSEKCKLGDDNSYIVTVYSLDYVRYNYFISFICLLCIETYWHGNAPSPFHLCIIMQTSNVNLSHHNTTPLLSFFKKIYVSIYCGVFHLLQFVHIAHPN